MTELPNSSGNGIDPPFARPGGQAPAGASPIGGASPKDLTPEALRAAPFAPDGQLEAGQLDTGQVDASRVAAKKCPPPAAGPKSKRLDRRARRRRAAAARDASFDWLAKGFTHQEIAAARKVSLAVVRRDIARAIRARQIESCDGHAQLQIARLTRGLAVVTHRIEKGDMAAVGPLVKLVTALDRYHAPEGAPAEPPRARLASPRLSSALPAPPLAIVHVAAPEPDGAAGDGSDEPATAVAEPLD